jgi:hypothetical protein
MLPPTAIVGSKSDDKERRSESSEPDDAVEFQAEEPGLPSAVFCLPSVVFVCCHLYSV